MLKDINVCDAPSSASQLTEMGGIVYFFSDDGIHGNELWRTDGTAAGTYMVIDINPGSQGFEAYHLTTAGSRLIFVHHILRSGFQIWTSDGTATGTRVFGAGRLVGWIHALVDTSPEVVFCGDPSIYTEDERFWADDGYHDLRALTELPARGPVTRIGNALWCGLYSALDGTEFAAKAPHTPGDQECRWYPQCTWPFGFTDVNGRCMFSASGGVWLETPNGFDVRVVQGAGAPNGGFSAACVSETYFFGASDATHGTELWRCDGNAANATMVLDINPGSFESRPRSLTSVGAELYFLANDGTHGVELWKSDGTGGGTAMVKDLTPGAGSSAISNLTAVGNTLFFTFDDGVHGTELWKSDGTDAGTAMFRDIFPGSTGSTPSNLMIYNGALLFTADDGVHGDELWRSDGTPGGTSMVFDINTNTLNSDAAGYVGVGGTTYFVADDGVHGRELWKTDNTEGGTVLVKDINPGPGRALSSGLTNVGGTLFFAANDGSHGTELWRSDGTPEGTTLVADINPGPGDSGPQQLTNVGGTLFFAANDGTDGTELWRSDGTPGGTTMVADINPGPGDSGPQQLTNVGGVLFFAANDGSHGIEVWRSDGTSQGTAILKDIRSGGQTSFPGGLTDAGGTLFFSGDDGIHGAELWKSNGTAAGTVMVKDICPGTVGSSPAAFTAMGNNVFFTADDGVTGRELWESDGTAQGTFLLGDLSLGSTSFDSFAVAGSELFFIANGAWELWKTNGTLGDLVFVQSISATTGLTAVGNWVFFGNNDGTNGAELWVSDGTTAGTELVADLYPGSTGSSPTALTAVGDRLFFTATDQFLDAEPWMILLSLTVTIDQAETQADPATTEPIRFTVEFSAPVTDFTDEDVTVSGTAPGTKTIEVTGSGTTYDVLVRGMTGDGTVVAAIAAGVAHDASGLANDASTSTDNQVTYSVNDAPILDPIGDKSVDEEVLLSFTVTASDPNDSPPNALTLSATGLPEGATFNPATGLFTWTPTEAQQGNYEVTFRVTDDGTPNLSDEETITITVNEVNSAPVLDPIGDKSVDDEQLLSFTVTASDPNDIPANTLTLSATGLPEGASLNPETGLFTWTPTESQQGAHQVTFRVTDDGVPNLSDEETITITVNGMEVLPAARGGYSLLLRVRPKDPQQLELVNAKSTKTQYWNGPADQNYTLTIVALDNKSDTLTVDTANGPLTNLQRVFFDAKGGGAKIVDKLVIKNSAKTAPATHDTVEILADRVVFNGTPYLAEGVESVSVDTGKGDDTIVVSALGKNVTLIDSGGTDALDFSQAGVGVTIDLNKTGGQAQKVFGPGDPNTLALKGTFENVIGTSEADWIKGNAAANLIYALGGDDTIYGGPGNDTLYGSAGNDWLYGDAGNDTLYGELGNNVLLGGDGNDQLDVELGVGSVLTGRNLLIGGKGLDTLRGGSGEEILVGGTTKYDSKPLALAAIMDEWASDTDFALRQTHLTDGITVPANPKLGLIQLVKKDKLHPKGTVLDDANVDKLLGGPGDDWFFPFANEVPNDG